MFITVVMVVAVWRSAREGEGLRCCRCCSCCLSVVEGVSGDGPPQTATIQLCPHA